MNLQLQASGYLHHQPISAGKQSQCWGGEFLHMCEQSWSTCQPPLCWPLRPKVFSIFPAMSVSVAQIPQAMHMTQHLRTPIPLAKAFAVAQVSYSAQAHCELLWNAEWVHLRFVAAFYILELSTSVQESKGTAMIYLYQLGLLSQVQITSAPPVPPDVGWHV